MQIRTLADLAAAVRDARQRQHLTQASLAKKSGVSRNWIIALESGTAARAELGRVLAVLAALDLPLNLAEEQPSKKSEGEAGWVEVPDFDLDAHLESFRTAPDIPRRPS